eukprot:1516485-Amphidinium_carterae.1
MFANPTHGATPASTLQDEVLMVAPLSEKRVHTGSPAFVLAGALPIELDVQEMHMGDVIDVCVKDGAVYKHGTQEVGAECAPNTISARLFLALSSSICMTHVNRTGQR